MRRRGSRIDGKKRPRAAWGSSTRCRRPVWPADEDGHHWPWYACRSAHTGAASITSLASTSISSCSTSRTHSRITSTPSPARNASNNSDTADWDRAIGDVLLRVLLQEHTENHVDGPTKWWTLRLSPTPNPAAKLAG